VASVAFVWLKIAALSDLLLDVECLINVLTYLLTSPVVYASWCLNVNHAVTEKRSC